MSGAGQGGATEPDHLYVVDLGGTFGRRLEKLAANAPWDEPEDYAAWLLRWAIEQAEGWEAEDREDSSPDRNSSTGPGQSAI